MDLCKKIKTDVVRILTACELIKTDQSWLELENQVQNDFDKKQFKKYYSLIDDYLTIGKNKTILPNVYIQNVSALLKIWEGGK